MKNVLIFNDSLLAETRIAESLLALKPQTSLGLLAKTKALQMIKEGAMNATFVLAVVNEFAKFPQDLALKGFVEQISETVNKRKNAFRLALVYENYLRTENNDTLGIKKNISESIDAIINENETAIAVSIMDGSLKNFKQHCQELRIIESEAINENIANSANVVTNELEISNPISYVEVVESTKTAYVRVGNRVFAVNENSILESNTPSESFTYLSEAAKKFASNTNENGRIEISTAIGVLVIEGSVISKVLENGELEVVEATTLIETFAAKAANRQINEAELQKVDSIVAVAENFESFKVLDNFTVVKNKNTNESALIALHGNAVYFGILESTRNFASFIPVSGINEAVMLCNNKIGVDVSKVFEAKINAEKEASVENAAAIAEIDESIAALDSRKAQVSESLLTTTTGSAANEAFLAIDIEISESLVALHKERKKLIEG